MTFSSLSKHTTSCVLPTASIDPWGGLIIASKLSIPIIPKLEIVIVPPFNSSAFNLLFLDLSINDFVSKLRSERFLFFMSLITGVVFGVLVDHLSSFPYAVAFPMLG